MSIQSKVNRWSAVGRFYMERMSDYGELVSIELAQARMQLAREVIALVALAVAVRAVVLLHRSACNGADDTLLRAGVLG
ncbi:hypothetical protein [Paraburkholderia sp. LEh10]|uniref:hypothetical protein n=1 Tax=Paraburkholderia sp. LEh10 TaxID=2821353 RepID=UPI001FD77968|nr:hypothetical protein [Paraburkholderia sp. LEh10]